MWQQRHRLFYTESEFQNKRLGVTYLFKHNSDLIGFATLCMGHLSREKIASEHRLRQRMQSYPALLIGQLAVWKDQQGNRIGTFICDYCLCKAIQLSEKVLGCRFLVVDAVKEAVKFYDGYGFVLAPKQDKEKQKLMFLDITKGKP
ncbi:MAG TPA: GNAT family N-acetyltransferase [Candidatus Limnocylindrales bacterium]|nr:GNAT family N-acetyltransferase [Candidatus Limnocylindrales bacterium]